MEGKDDYINVGTEAITGEVEITAEPKYKLTFGRKFLACLLGIAVLLTIYLVTLFQYPEAITKTVTIMYGTFSVTLVMMYVGGNVWNSWVTSKYFKPELVNK